MPRDLISRGTRDEFRETLSGFFTLRTIVDAFAAGGIAYRDVEGCQVMGQRRGLVEGYYASVDFQNADHIADLLLVYEEIVFKLEREGTPESRRAKEALLLRMKRDGFDHVDGRFTSPKLDVRTVNVGDLTSATEAAVHEHIEKANAHLASGEYADAIIYCYTLVEQLLKIILRDRGVTFKAEEGDIRSLYRLVAEELNMLASSETIDRPLKPILDGLQKLVGGIYEVANKASNRHVKAYSPARRHAKLAINASLALCDYVVESAAFQAKSGADVGSKP
ncbi:abortive infection family protein [Aureimonas glaciei]|uniref:Abortive infection protein-like C-terminal domain-containing protein n=1 Tax=Aureimonas glaciei TaxID=1776957 RepID=A0A916Y0T1_9HYPH|nr:abortive infection family protein [Aureimonas glaciei]GGD25911.1 hypothetical protein GCM10011335_31150 [Aureimonas glaciei]